MTASAKVLQKEAGGVAEIDWFREYMDLAENVRLQGSSYFERLAVLCGGTIALCVTAVLGQSLYSHIKHRYTFAWAIGILVLALITLLVRNLYAVLEQRHFLKATIAIRSNKAYKHQPKYEACRTIQKVAEIAGTVLTIVGIVLLSVIVLTVIVP